MDHELNPEYRKGLIEHTARGVAIEPHAAPYGTGEGWDPMKYDHKKQKPMAGAVQTQRPIQGPPHWTQIWPTYADTGVGHQRYTSVADLLTAEDLAYLQTAHVGSVGAIKFDKRLGAGGVGGVWQVESHNGWGRTRHMACKVLPFKYRKDTENSVIVRHLMGDMYALQSLPFHPNIVNTVDIVAIPDPQTGFPYSMVCIFSELCDGDLNSLCKQNGMPEAQVLEWVRQIASALRFLHVKQRMVHLDVKPHNIVYKLSPDGQRRTYKLCDFGTAIQFTINSAMKVAHGRFGTQAYRAPEMGGYGCNTTLYDVYSLGASMAHTLLGMRDFARNHQQQRLKLFQSLAKGIQMRPKDPISAGVAKLVESLLATDPTHRPTMEEVCNHSLLK